MSAPPLAVAAAAGALLAPAGLWFSELVFCLWVLLHFGGLNGICLVNCFRRFWPEIMVARSSNWRGFFLADLGPVVSTGLCFGGTAPSSVAIGVKTLRRLQLLGRLTRRQSVVGSLYSEEVGGLPK
ncbi:unnamed protein product [Cuscuta europaea]|uniref:Uncharacterized protein n=1 Tax=Cuscuta europaea TaxID=41803 RepID=A0A9P1E3U3_CUSEU|nr:unnamed protein product [Cuscuta europaea]